MSESRKKLASRAIRWAALTSGLAIVTGCAGERSGDAMARFARDRGRDAIDVVGMQFGFGPGLLLRAEITKYVAIGAGSLGGTTPWAHYRFDPRFVGWSAREGGVWIERRDELGISTFYMCECSTELIAGDMEHFGLAARRPTDIAAELFLGLVGVGCQLRVAEAVDFVAGWVGADPARDDEPSSDSVQPSNAARKDDSDASPAAGN